ncbi:MAG: hypothetical protein GX922_02985 [Firmicutes bacterium]|nr:hypothetical protein [Bacillota bacterium]
MGDTKTVMLYGFKDYEIDEYMAYSLKDTLTSYYFEQLELPLTAIFSE